ncbi:hypothetical protein EYZ11_001843 [Aspergillus tanneri]|uniref:Uncharacterized protein n=1 Tax=Aspergillus tanneri TaxID=1220188 RepID=A0A4S3JSY0_9EURO|nr:uncharacterized protein ATNIH1004_003604 [Aspergillus tanneri]KAA8650914.1 hypothetical protein ATNIH1004_003604 [Aspergillus tanneri]THC98640.1 hypothetical protein EYZ11_001843 [Aspergillus tanneri]
MFLARAQMLRSSIRAVRATARGPAQQFARRTYASGQSHEGKKSSDLPWLLGSVGLGGPTIYYLSQSVPEKKPHDHDLHGDEHHATVEEGEKGQNVAETPAAAVKPEPQPDRDAEQKTEGESKPEEPQGSSLGEAHSNVDPHESRKAPGDSTGSISAKQEGISNTDTSNPLVNEPGENIKSEAEIETAKAKGAVYPEQPQA